MEDCDQVSGHCGNTIQGQAWRECQRDHLPDTSAAEGLGMDQCWADVLAVAFPEDLTTQPEAVERAVLW